MIGGQKITRRFTHGSIVGLTWKALTKHHDPRGWLCELFRQDEIPPEFHPVMAYASTTEPGQVRGPHEHLFQTDLFCFLGPSMFQLALWDNRPDSPSFLTRQTALVGVENPMLVIIPPGIVHGYKNVGTTAGLVFNCPNRLFRGPGRQEEVDEIRHEEDPDSPFRLDP